MSETDDFLTDDEWVVFEKYHHDVNFAGGYPPCIRVVRGMVVVAYCEPGTDEAELSVYTVAQVKRAFQKAREWMRAETSEEYEEPDLLEALIETGMREYR